MDQLVGEGGAGLVFQAPSLIPSLDVVENIALPLIVTGIGDDEARTRARAALELLDLDWLAVSESEDRRQIGLAIAAMLADAAKR